MRFWKPVLLTTFSFFAFVTTILYTACEKNPCNNVNCLNGGSCNNGFCRCPTGWENTQCQSKTIDRFIGTYYGYMGCDNGAQIYDTITIKADNRAINTVSVYMRSLQNTKVLQGYASNNESTYAIVVTNNDSSKAGSPFYRRVWTITLQNDNKLIVNNYLTDYYTNPAGGVDTTEQKCYFNGVKMK
jgi:hypothetical protein